MKKNTIIIHNKPKEADDYAPLITEERVGYTMQDILPMGTKLQSLLSASEQVGQQFSTMLEYRGAENEFFE